MRVYLAGPIFGKTDAQCNDWRAAFKTDTSRTWLDPMTRDYRGREDACFKEIVENDKDDIESCDAVIANLLQGPSIGTSMEIGWAWLAFKPVIVIVQGRISPWLRYHATHFAANEQEAIEALATCASS